MSSKKYFELCPTISKNSESHGKINNNLMMLQNMQQHSLLFLNELIKSKSTFSKILVEAIYNKGGVET
jgi:hypothetical protein